MNLQITEVLGIGNLFDNHELYDIDLCKSILWTLSERDFIEEAHQKPKLCSCITFKDNIKTEGNLQGYMPKYKRSLLIQFRCGILSLEIEVGRFKNVKDNITGNFRKLRFEERTCNMCQVNLVGDEIHFLCVCDKYQELWCTQKKLLNINIQKVILKI